MWAAIAISLAFQALSYFLSPKPAGNQGAVAGELDIPEPPVGKPVPVIFGTVWVKDAGVVYYGNPEQRPIKSDGGKKG